MCLSKPSNQGPSLSGGSYSQTHGCVISALKWSLELQALCLCVPMKLKTLGNQCTIKTHNHSPMVLLQGHRAAVWRFIQIRDCVSFLATAAVCHFCYTVAAQMSCECRNVVLTVRFRVAPSLTPLAHRWHQVARRRRMEGKAIVPIIQ